MSRLLLLTRDINAAAENAKYLRQHNVNSIIQPLAIISEQNTEIIDCNDKIIIITSYNGQRFLKKNLEFLKNSKQILVVGEKLHNYLHEFAIANQFFYNAELMLSYIKENFKKKSDFLYLRGNIIRMDFKYELELLNHNIAEEIIYQVNYLDCLTTDLITKIKQGRISDHMSFSEFNAENLLKLLKDQEILEYAQNIKIFALSERIAERFKNNGFKKIYYPDIPLLKDLYALCLDSH